MDKVKTYSFKEATKGKDYKGYGQQESDNKLKESYKTGIYKGFPDEEGFRDLEEAVQTNELRTAIKFLQRDMIHNHHFSLPKIRMVIYDVVKLYETLISAQTVSNSMLRQTANKIAGVEKKMQTNISHRGGEDESELEIAAGLRKK